MRILFRGGRIIDPASQRDETGDLLVEDGKILEVGGEIEVDEDAREVNANGAWILPGLIDLGPRLGEPGFENTSKPSIPLQRLRSRVGLPRLRLLRRPNLSSIARSWFASSSRLALPQTAVVFCLWVRSRKVLRMRRWQRWQP